MAFSWIRRTSATVGFSYTKPWTMRFNWRLGADEDLIEFICQENNLDEQFLQ